MAHGAQLAFDVKHAFRRLTRVPTFAITAMAVLSLGIAANVTVFSMANAVLLQPLTFLEPERVVLFQTASPARAVNTASPVMFWHWRKPTEVIQDVAAFHPAVVNDTSGSHPVQLRASRISADYFRLFGAAPARGRTFTSEDDRPSGDLVVVLAHRFWAARFGGTDAIGKSMRLDGESYTIVGVMDTSFRGDDYGSGVDLWLPLRLDPAARTEGHFLAVAGRLRPNVTLAQAQAHVRRSTEDFRREFPNALSRSSTFDLQPLREALIGNTRTVFFVLLVAVAFVLLIACSNLATLVLLQGSSRRREIAIRAAIGAGRGRIVRQLLTENMVLSFVAGAIGLGLGWVAVRALVTNISGLPRLLDSVTLDWRVVAFTTALSLITALLFGLVPALRVSRADLSAGTIVGTAPSSRGPERRRLEAGLVVLQVSLALVLLIGSGLLIRTVIALVRVETGFNPDRVLTMRTSLSGPDFASATRVGTLVRQGKESIRPVPGVVAVAASYGLPLADGGALPFEIVGRPLPDGRAYHGGAGWWAISPSYFQVLEIPLVRGRDFSDDDSRHTPAVVIINEMLARQNWPDNDPLGKQLVLGRGTGPQFADEPVREIVGVVGSVRGRLETDPGPEAYVPQAQLPDVANAFVASRGPMAWLVRTTVPPEGLARTLQQTLEQATGLPVSNVRSMNEIALRSISRQRLSMWLMTGFGSAALLLAMIGLYGLVAYSVEQRTREIGIRLALGAAAFDVKRMVIGQGMRMMVTATAIGVLAALALTRLMARLLFQVQPWDPASFVVVVALVLIVTGLALWIPARRASRVDPVVALKFE